MSNALAHEPSLYLRQHAGNPVDWLPWGTAAFAEARRRRVPVLVSVGYSSCHWCHVMAHECFEDDYIAGLMNTHFVCVKVDREERPDVDKLCMDAVQMIVGHGGWPLNVFFLPDGRPFFGGTYFPAVDRGQGIIPWPQLLMRISDRFQRAGHELEENAGAILANLSFASDTPPEPGTALDDTALREAARTLCTLHDDTDGGFGPAPKFPSPLALNFLISLRDDAEKNDPALSDRIGQVVSKTLASMAQGALFDQLGGGFFRYCVDKQWRVPHFEKMLSDNGLLLETYARAALAFPGDTWRAVSEETAAWLLREMRNDTGGFAASLDADTPAGEGATYVWTPAQVRAALGNDTDAQTACAAHGILAKGNFANGASTPTFASADFSRRAELRPLREKLLAARRQRPQPGRDTKVITGWNALAIRGLAQAGWALDRPDWVRQARVVEKFLWSALRDNTGKLHAIHYPGTGAAHAGTLNDYAWLAQAELALAAVAGWAEPDDPAAGAVHRERARQLAKTILDRFPDDTGQPGFFLSDRDTADLPLRQKDWWDHAVPAGNAALVHVFSTLTALTGESRWRDALAALRKHYAALAGRAPHGIAHALEGFARARQPVAVLKINAPANWAAWRQSLLNPVANGHILPLLENDTSQPAGFQLCIDGTCHRPHATLSAALTSR